MGSFRSLRSVLLAVPQLLGYLRALMYTAGFIVVDRANLLEVGPITIEGYQVCLFLYTVAFILDLFDGMAARALGQTSLLGGVLDMVIDRAATAALLTVLAGSFSRYRLVFAGLVALDVGSHWMHVAGCQLAPTKMHHKSDETLKNRNVLIRLYYGVYPFFGYCCVGTEVFYMLLLALAYAPAAGVTVVAGFKITLVDIALYVCFPACVIKNTVNVMQLCSAVVNLAELDVIDADAKSS